MSDSLTELLSEAGLAALPLTFRTATRVTRSELVASRSVPSEHYRTSRYRAGSLHKPVSRCVPRHAVPPLAPRTEER